jgi:hypothetical protein
MLGSWREADAPDAGAAAPPRAAEDWAKKLMAKSSTWQKCPRYIFELLANLPTIPLTVTTVTEPSLLKPLILLAK